MTTEPLCDGNVCVDCCLCDKCGRHVGTRHLDACACPPDGLHYRCDDCAEKFRQERIDRVVSVLAPYERYGDDH